MHDNYVKILSSEITYVLVFIGPAYCQLDIVARQYVVIINNILCYFIVIIVAAIMDWFSLSTTETAHSSRQSGE